MDKVNTIMWIATILLLTGGIPYSGSSIHYDGPLPIISSRPDITTVIKGSSGVFIENKGQWDPEILFVSRTSYGHIGLGIDAVYHHVALYKTEEDPQFPDMRTTRKILDRGCVIKISFGGCNIPLVSGKDSDGAYHNFFLGNDSSRWTSECRGYRSVSYENIWDGIDLIYYFFGNGLKYDLILEPHADPDDISMNVEGADAIRTVGSDLSMISPIGAELLDTGLRTFYMEDEASIPSSFSISGDSYGFDLGMYDASKRIVIDPEFNVLALNYSTYLGGSRPEYPEDMMIDDECNVYICGSTYSINFPTTPGAYNTALTGGYDAFAMKLDKRGRPVFGTYIGGSHMDTATSIRNDDQMVSIYLSGETDSSNFPVTNDAYQKVKKDRDLFLLKLNSSGSELIKSTFIGGSKLETEAQIDIDSEGDVILVATTGSLDFPITHDSYQNINLGGAFVIVLFDLSNMNLIYSSFLGGSMGWGITKKIYFDNNGNIYVGGYTGCSDFNVTIGAYDTTFNGGVDGFIFKFDLVNNTLVYCTYYGGSKDDYIEDITIDDKGNVYACGRTYSSDSPTNRIGGFIIGFDGNCSNLILCKVHPQSWSIIWTADGSLHTTGIKNPEVVIIPGSFQYIHPGGYDAFYMRMKDDGSKTLYSTFIGGSADDRGYAIAFDRISNEPIIAGTTESDDFPTKRESFDRFFNGESDVFVIKINLTLPPTTPNNATAIPGDTFVHFEWDPPDWDGGSPVTGYRITRSERENVSRMRTIVTTETLFNDTDVKNGIEYDYLIQAKNVICTGIEGAQLSALPASVPSTPKNVSISFGDRNIAVYWNLFNDHGGIPILEYRLYRRDQNGASKVVPVQFRPSTMYLDEDVINGVNYRYQVKAVNGLGESLPSQEVNATPRTTPGKVEGIRVLSGGGYIHLSWDAPEDNGSAILGYEIVKYRDTDEFSPITIEVERPQYNDTDVVNGIAYTYRIRAYNSEGYGPDSNAVNGYPAASPSMPLNLKASVKPGTITLSWSEPASSGGIMVLGYRIYRSEGGEDFLYIAEARSKMFEDGGLTNGRVYGYRVTAFNAVGESGPAEIEDLEPLDVPGTVAGFTLRWGPGYVHLFWDHPSYDGGTPVLRYVIQRSDESISVGNDVTSYNDTSVINGMTYTYSILAVNRIGYGSASEILTARPMGTPSPPSNVVISAGNGYVDISWSPPLDSAGSAVRNIRIYRGSHLDELELIRTTNSLQGSYHDTEVINGDHYFYALTAENSMGEGPFSEPVEVKPVGPPSSPISLLIRTISARSIQLAWEPPESDGGSPIISYLIYRMNDMGEYLIAGDAGPDNLTFSEDGLVPGRVYRYRVSAVNDAGESDPSEIVLIQMDRDPKDRTLFIILSMCLLVFASIAVVILLSRRRKPKDPLKAQEKT